MNKFDIFILALHAFFFAIWAMDSRTIEASRNRRAYWRAFEENSRKDKIFDQELDNLLTEYRQKLRQEAMQRHPASSVKNQLIQQDNQTLARVIKKEFEDKQRFGANHIAGKELNFWPLINRHQKNKDLN